MIREAEFVKKTLDHPGSSINFIILRHPYHRLIATYLQNIKGNMDLPLREHVCVQSQLGNRRKISCNFISFTRFIDYVIKDSHTPNQMNPYWAPISSTCPVCSPDIDWHFILNFEDFDESQWYMIEQECF